jgi:hypothetical protein
VQTVINAGKGAAVGYRRRSGLFSAIAMAMLLVVIVGFAQTFFLRPSLTCRPCQATCWFMELS